MIRPVSDYRIGNLALDEDGELCMIEQLSSSKMECFQQVSNIENKSCISKKYPSNIYAIKLTEEWLIKFGFNSQYKKGWIGIDVKHSNGTTTDFVLSYPQRMGMWQTFFAFEYDGFRFVEIKYVHQLQNIFFALTNKELELIKE